MRLRALLLALLLALALAGCADDADDGAGDDDDDARGDATDEGTGADARNETSRIPIDVQAGGAPGPLEQPGASGDATVGANATRLVVNATWSCATGACSGAVVVVDEEGNSLGDARGDGEALVEVDDPPAGTLTVQWFPAQPVVQVSGEMVVTVFYDG